MSFLTKKIYFYAPASLLFLALTGCQSLHWPHFVNWRAEKPKEVPQKEQTKEVAESAEKVWVKGGEPLTNHCEKELSDLPGHSNQDRNYSKLCNKVEVLHQCESVAGRPIFHYDRPGQAKNGKRIFTMALIHGDEVPSGSVARSWMQRLANINPRNHWRVVPIANPDGLKLGTRMNANGVDLNRNFPSTDWDKEAIEKWVKLKKRDPRRYPGEAPASEAETQCFIEHFEKFQPDFIISIHTPLAVLDFDGPKMRFPDFSPLPWISLGTFPGSLGRYMWEDEGTPVLTIELTPDGGISQLEQFDHLQDISGTVAIQAGKLLKSSDDEPQESPN